MIFNPLAAVAAEPPAENVFTIGGGVAAVSSYSGSDKLPASPLIILDYAMANGLFISTSRGIGYGGQAGPFSYSAALGYRGNREDHKRNGANGWGGSDYLKGMGEVKGNASALLSAGYSLPGLSLSISSDIPLSNRENGANVHFRRDRPDLRPRRCQGRAAGQREHRWPAGLGRTQVCADHVWRRPPRPRIPRSSSTRPRAVSMKHRPPSTGEHRFDARWGINTLVGVEHRMGDCAKSPIVQRKTAPIGAVYVTYRY